MSFNYFTLFFICLKVSMTSQLDRGVNLALGKPTYQSNTILKGVSSNAVDGYRHPDFSKNSCIHTDIWYEPWWYVDLQETHYVTSVVISNRGDCCHEQLTNFEVRVGSSDLEGGRRNAKCAPAFLGFVGAGKSVEIVCDEPLGGRYVTVVIPGNAAVLNFCEVEVYGRKPSTVLRLKVISNGYAESNGGNSFSMLFIGNDRYTFRSRGISIRLLEVKTGRLYELKSFDTHGKESSEEELKNYLKAIADDTIVVMVIFLSGANYYQDSLPYFEEMVGHPLTADLEYGESWALLGYKGIKSPIPHWRKSVRKKMGEGPSTVAKLVTLRKAPSGPPTNLEVVATTGTSLKLTWTRPFDYLTDDDYPFDYDVCIKNAQHDSCDRVIKQLHHTITALQPLTTYTVTVRARSADMTGDAANVGATTVEQVANFIKVKLTSRLHEDAFYRVDGEPHSSVVVAGVAYNFDQRGLNFLTLDALTGKVVESKSFNTNDDPDSGSKMAAYLATVPDKTIILMVVYYRAHVYYDDAAAPLSKICPNAPSSLAEDQSNALICLKGLGTTPWMESKLSTYSVGPTVLEQEFLLPKDLLTSPTITKIFAGSSSLGMEWTAPVTDKFTGPINRYEICYTGDFGTDKCIEVDGRKLQWTIVDLHPYTEYEVKLRAGAYLTYGPFSAVRKETTLQAAPSGPPQQLVAEHVNKSSIRVSWAAPLKIDQNGVITGFSACLRRAVGAQPCIYTANNTADQMSSEFANLQPFTKYLIQVRAKTVIGYGPPANVTQTTSTAAPSGPPIDLRVNFINSSSLTATWSPPEQMLRNGIIQKYKICVRAYTSLGACQYHILPASQTNYTASSLRPYSVYDVIITAGTSVGFGPTALVVNRTLQSAPSSPPLLFRVMSVNSSFLNLTWESPKPEDHNGVLTKYRLTILPDATSLLSKRTVLLSSEHVSYLVTDLRAFVYYVMEIRAGTGAGFGPAAVVTVTTSMAAPSGPPTHVRITNITLTTFQIAWSPPAKENRNGIITSYYLCIREFGVLHACNDTRNVSGSQDRYLFTGLNRGKEYLVEIKAATAEGSGISAFVQKMAGQCDNALVHNPDKIPHYRFSASGHMGNKHEPFQARLDNLHLWCEDGAKTGAYLQIDLGGSLRIIAVATEGDMTHFNSWIKSYNLLYGTNAVSWTTASVGGKEAILGNVGEGIVKHYLDEPVLTRFVRFRVLSFYGKHQCTRVEIFGCSPAFSPVSISVVSWNATSIEVSWQQSKEADTNGEILGYVICPRVTSSLTCQSNKTYAGPGERSKVIGGLIPYTSYSLEIASYNVAGEGPSINVRQETAEAAPSASPESIEVLATTPTSIRIFWSQVREDERNGVITKYFLCYQEFQLSHSCSAFQEISSGTRNYLLSGLKPFTKYLILVRAATVAGSGPAASLGHLTLSAPPSGAPTSVSVNHLGATVLQVTWSPPEVEKRNGVIVGYRLCAQDANETGACHNQIVVSGTDRLHAIAGLRPYTMYTVSVEARTTGGYGPAIVFHHKTGESVPSGAPGEISVTFVNETAISMHWGRPDQRQIHGALTSYLLVLHEQLDDGNLKMISTKTVPHQDLAWTFSGLQSKTEYIIEVKAGTAQGFGPPSVVHQRTAGAADVTYVKKSNKAYLALAKAGIAAGVLSVMGMVGFFVFVSLLVTGYVPYTSPWRKRRKRLWREKVLKQKEERQKKGSDDDDSEFGSSDSDSSGESDSSDEGSGDIYGPTSQFIYGPTNPHLNPSPPRPQGEVTAENLYGVIGRPSVYA